MDANHARLNVEEAMAAIRRRISCRAYDERAVEPEKLEAIGRALERVRAASGLNLQLIGPDGGMDRPLALSKRMFAGGVEHYLALVGPDTDEAKERVGYYGEELVLLITHLGLGCCWVAGTFDRESARCALAAGEVLHDVIPFGYAKEKTPLKQRTIRASIRRRDKKPEALYQGPSSLADAPAWIRAGIESVQMGPSAVNEQPVVFVQGSPDAPLRTSLPVVKSGEEPTDLGIAKLHFQTAAASCGVHGSWEWGESGAFHIEEAQA